MIWVLIRDWFFLFAAYRYHGFEQSPAAINALQDLIDGVRG